MGQSEAVLVLKGYLFVVYFLTKREDFVPCVIFTFTHFVI